MPPTFVSIPGPRAVWRGGLLAVCGLWLLAGPATAQGPIKVGELNSYSRFPAFTAPYRNGWTLGMEEINAAGGVLGRPLQIISRDDGGSPADAVRVAEELVSSEQVSLFFGSLLSNVGVALTDFAAQKEIYFIAAEPLSDAITMEKGNRFTFRPRTNTYMQTGMLVEEAAKLGLKRWAIVAPNYEFGQSAAAAFKRLLAEAVPGAEIVGEQYPPLGKIDAGATVQALVGARPEGIFNVLFGGDLVKFVRQGEDRGLFRGRTVLSLITGDPEWLAPLGEDTPEGWIVTGYPWYGIESPAHDTFVAAYKARFDEDPTLGAMLGYTIAYMIEKVIVTAGSTDTDAMIEATRGLKLDTPVGQMWFRPIDHQGTLGAYVGKLARGADGGYMVDWRYADGAYYLHPPAEVKVKRPRD